MCVCNPCFKKKQKNHGLKRSYSFLKEPASEDMKLCFMRSLGKTWEKLKSYIKRHWNFYLFMKLWNLKLPKVIVVSLKICKKSKNVIWDIGGKG